jgi:predicted transcriptional regulator
MTQPTHRPPSRQRYQATHPTVTLHLNLATDARLKELMQKTSLSRAQLMEEALGLVESRVEEAQTACDRGYHLGFADARDRFRITPRCAWCDGEMEVTRGSVAAQAATDFLEGELWVHSACPSGEPVEQQVDPERLRRHGPKEGDES